MQTTLNYIILCRVRFPIPDVVYLSRRPTVKSYHMKVEEPPLPGHWVGQHKNEMYLGCCLSVPTAQPLERKTKAAARKLKLDEKKLKSGAQNTIYSIGLSFGKRTRNSHRKRGWGGGSGQAYRDRSATTNGGPQPGSQRQKITASRQKN